MIRLFNERRQIVAKATLYYPGRAVLSKTTNEVFPGRTALGPLNQSGESSEGICCHMLDRKSVDIEIRLKVWRGACCHSTRHDFAKVGVRGSRANGDPPLHLKAQPTPSIAVIEFDDYIVHRMALPLLLDGNTRDDPFLPGSTFLAQEGSEVVRDDRIFEREPCTPR